MTESTRDRLIAAALRLFGEQGFARSTVSQIEREAGLSGGSGAMYRHFQSKDELLIEAVRSRLVDRGVWSALLAPEFSIVEGLDAFAPQGTLADKVTALLSFALTRMDHDRDINRILVRDNSIGPEVLEIFRREEYMVFVSVALRALQEFAGPQGREQDWEAVAAVLVGSVAHYWLISDTFGGTHPTGVQPQRYLHAVAEMVVALMESTDSPGGEQP